jgi:hypothetical protein
LSIGVAVTVGVGVAVSVAVGVAVSVAVGSASRSWWRSPSASG